MSAREGLSRRQLFGLFRRAEAPASRPAAAAVTPPAPPPAPAPAAGGGFSLEAFYSERARTGTRTGASLPVFSLREGLRAGMRVRVRPGLCLAWQGSFCSTCSERCPVGGAIALELGRPRVVEERCDGCGLCVQVCPAPLNALEFIASQPREGTS